MTGYDAVTGVPAAWYPDPQGSPLLRWWDGAAWTAHTRERPTQTVAARAEAAPAEAVQTVAVRAEAAPAEAVPQSVPMSVPQPVPEFAAVRSRATAEPENAYVPMRDFALQRAQPAAVPFMVGEHGSTQTAAAWMLALYPLLQLAILFVVSFVAQSFGGDSTRYAVSGSSIAFSLYCGYADNKALKARGYRPPGWGWALLPLVYFIIRTVRVGPSSLGPLFAWSALQIIFTVIIAASVVLPLYLAMRSDGGLSPGDRATLLTPEGMSEGVAADLAANGYEVTGVECGQLASTTTGSRVSCTANTPTSTLSVVVEATPADPKHAYALVSGVEYDR